MNTSEEIKNKKNKILKTSSKEWTYLTEGNAHIIFKYAKEGGPFSGKLLVLEKSKIDNGLNNLYVFIILHNLYNIIPQVRNKFKKFQPKIFYL